MTLKYIKISLFCLCLGVRYHFSVHAFGNFQVCYSPRIKVIMNVPVAFETTNKLHGVRSSKWDNLVDEDEEFEPQVRAILGKSIEFDLDQRVERM